MLSEAFQVSNILTSSIMGLKPSIVHLYLKGIYSALYHGYRIRKPEAFLSTILRNATREWTTHVDRGETLGSRLFRLGEG